MGYLNCTFPSRLALTGLRMRMNKTAKSYNKPNTRKGKPSETDRRCIHSSAIKGITRTALMIAGHLMPRKIFVTCLCSLNGFVQTVQPAAIVEMTPETIRKLTNREEMRLCAALFQAVRCRKRAHLTAELQIEAAVKSG